MSGSGISWATCKSASRSRQITMPVPHHSKVFYRLDALLAAQPTASKHWRLRKPSQHRQQIMAHLSGVGRKTTTQSINQRSADNPLYQETVLSALWVLDLCAKYTCITEITTSSILSAMTLFVIAAEPETPHSVNMNPTNPILHTATTLEKLINHYILAMVQWPISHWSFKIWQKTQDGSWPQFLKKLFNHNVSATCIEDYLWNQLNDKFWLPSEMEKS